MSSTFSELAATSLIRDLAAAPSSGRHLVTSVAGGDLDGLFRAALARATDARELKVGDGSPAELQVIVPDDGIAIVPYLVQEPPPASPRQNRGGQGFLGAVRDRFEEIARPGERLHLLTFDDRPNETELTTMDQSLVTAALSPTRVLAIALEPPEGTGQAGRRVFDELPALITKQRIEVTPEQIGEAASAGQEISQASSNSEVAETLYRFPWILRDPRLFEYAGRDFTRRLDAGFGLRKEITEWLTDPTTDFDAAVRGRFAPNAAELLISARYGQSIDWSAFSFDDLASGEPPPDEEPLRFAPLPVEVHNATALKLLPHGTVAVHLREPRTSLTFHLTRPLTGKATIHVDGFAGERAPFARTSLATLRASDSNGSPDMACTLDAIPEPRDGWSFVEVVLTTGARITKSGRLGELILAFRIAAEDETLIYSPDGVVDLDAQAYSADEDVTFVGEQDGAEVFSEAVEPTREDGELVAVGGAWSAPAIQDLQPDDVSEDIPPTESPLHLAIETWAAGQLPPGELTFSVRARPDGTVVADAGIVQRPIETGDGMPLPRWQLEQYIIAHPELTTFEVTATGEIQGAEQVHALEVGALEEPFNRFLAARIEFFGQLAMSDVPTALAVPLHASDEARRYVDAYNALLQQIPDGEPGQLGYDKILLSDAVLVPASGEVLFAPTNPVAIAAHASFEREVRSWIQTEPCGNYFRGDSAAITQRSLIPFLRLQTGLPEWLEPGYAPYPWRRYLPVSRRAALQRPPTLHRYIARRVERFLDVHPNYRDDRRILRLAFINPGSASHVRDALLLLVEPLVRGREVHLPLFELQLLADAGSPQSDVLGSDLDLFMSLTPEDGQPSDATLEVMKRLSYTKGNASEFLTDPKAFAHLTFVEDFFRPQPELVEWPRRSHPTSHYVGALAADTERLPQIDPASTRFLTSTWTGTAGDNPIVALATRIQEVAASAAGVPVKRGITRATDVRVPNSVIPQLYDRSVWVVHIDRHIGLELFYPQTVGSQAPYILDYTDQDSPDPGVFDGITATQQVAPYHARIGAILGAITGEPLQPEATGRLLRTLNLISGRWGIEMLQTEDNKLRGRLATVIAAQALEEAERYHEDSNILTMVIALDELLRATGAEGLPVSQGWLAKSGRKGGGSDDLLILSIPLGAGIPRLRGRIVEVKYRSVVGTSPDEAADQIRNTFDLLETLLCATAEPGRSFQGRHLAKLILRYTGRHTTYGIGGSRPAVSSATEALSHIALGEYELDLNTFAPGTDLIGDFVSVEPKFNESAVERHIYAAANGAQIGRIRIGLPVIRRLLSSREIAESESAAPPSESAATEGQPDTDRLALATDATSTDAKARDTMELAQDWDVATGAARPEPSPKAGDTSRTAIYAFAIDDYVLREQAARLDDVLTSFHLPLQPVEAANAVCGPNVIRFRVRMARGGTIAQLEPRERDIMRELGSERPVMIDQDAGFVTFDIPRSDPVTVRFADLVGVMRGPRTRGQLPVLFGVDVSGTPRLENLASLPHVLIAGTTGAGKSVFLSSVIASLARLPPTEVEIVLIDVKGLDFAPYKELEHLRQPPIGDPETALATLEDLYQTERPRRQQVLATAGAQSILDYFDRLGGSDLTQVVVIIDEFSNLLAGDKATGSELEDVVQKYAEIMRSFGIYLVIATQRPSADIVTGRIKANLPARCAFRLPTAVDSVTILGRKGAEQLLGKGDMLFYRDGAIERLQAPLTTPQDVLAARREE
jgi:hypothetical protein